ncbi:hypothetical protein [Amycolatopsis sp. NPDC052450]|uniref:hypothetical protein n=1 Tax=Amycolatopsis sp. NPDC052450 TaxID=3363937 RepID=UPI0037C650D1
MVAVLQGEGPQGGSLVASQVTYGDTWTVVKKQTIVSCCNTCEQRLEISSSPQRIIAFCSWHCLWQGMRALWKSPEYQASLARSMGLVNTMVLDLGQHRAAQKERGD